MTQEEYLAHHGILGQKWGVRRYQNEDGTLTDLGKKRYAKSIARSNIGKKNYSDSSIPDPIKKEVGRKLEAHRAELKQVQKDQDADFDYEMKKLWGNEKILNKYAGKMADDMIADGSGTDRDKLLWLIKYDDVGQNLFADYYLKDHPNEAKEYSKLQDKSRAAFNRQREIEKEITNDLLGAYGNTILTSISKYGVWENGRYKVQQRASSGSVLQDYTRREIEKKY